MLQVVVYHFLPKTFTLIFALFLKIFKSEFLIQDFISRFSSERKRNISISSLSLGVDNQKQIKFWKLKMLLLFNGSLNTLRFSAHPVKNFYDKMSTNMLLSSSLWHSCWSGLTLRFSNYFILSIAPDFFDLFMKRIQNCFSKLLTLAILRASFVSFMWASQMSSRAHWEVTKRFVLLTV